MNLKWLAFLLALGFPFAALAVPAITSIAGTVTDGDTLTITGTGFGTHTLRYSFLGGPNGVTDNDSLRAAMTHIDDLHAIGLQGWQTQSVSRGGNQCKTDTLFITRLRANEHVRQNRKSSIVTYTNQLDGNICYTNGWGFYQQNKDPYDSFGDPYRSEPWWDTDTLTTRSIYMSWWQYEEDLFDARIGQYGNKLSGPGTGYAKDTWQVFNTYHNGPGHFWFTLQYSDRINDIADRANFGDVYSGCYLLCTCGPFCTFPCRDHCIPCPQPFGLEHSWCSGCGTPCESQITYSPRSKWVRWEAYVRANRDSSEGATTEYEGVARIGYQGVGRPFTCIYNKGGTGNGILTHQWYWREFALSGSRDDSCGVVNGQMATWNKWTTWRFINFSQAQDEQTNSYDDVYFQADTQARVMVGDAPTYAQCTQLEIQQPAAWDTTEVRVVFNQGSFQTNQCLYAYLVDGDNVASNGVKIWNGCVPCCPDSCKPDCTAACIDAAQ